MKDQSSISGYAYANAQNTHAHAYLLPSVNAELAVVKERPPPPLDSSIWAAAMEVLGLSSQNRGGL